MESPEYVQPKLCVPPVRPVRLSVAIPLVTAWGEPETPSMMKVTVPVGVLTEVDVGEEMVAVSVIGVLP